MRFPPDSNPSMPSNSPILQASNHPIIQVGTAECAERLNPPHPCRRVKCLTKACMQTPAPTPAKTRRVMHANATLPPLPPAPRIAPTCADFRFFFRFFSHCKFSCKKMRSKIAKIADPGFLASLKGQKKIKKSKKLENGVPRASILGLF